MSLVHLDTQRHLVVGPLLLCSHRLEQPQGVLDGIVTAIGGPEVKLVARLLHLVVGMRGDLIAVVSVNAQVVGLQVLPQGIIGRRFRLHGADGHRRSANIVHLERGGRVRELRIACIAHSCCRIHIEILRTELETVIGIVQGLEVEDTRRVVLYGQDLDISAHGRMRRQRAAVLDVT